VALRTVSICTGGTAGLELGLRIAFRNVIPLCYVEREKTACETLVARFEDGSLDAAPIWSDLASFDGTRFRGLVDLCSAGLPCQPYSVAGKRKGHSDERAISPEFIRVVGEMLPTLVFLENVPEFLKYFRPVGDELSRLGYRVEEPLLIAASNVGTSHKRLRVFILAHRRFGSSGRRKPLTISGCGGTSDDLHGREELAESQIGGRRELRGPSEIGIRFSDRHHEAMADAQDIARSLHARSRDHGPGAAKFDRRVANVAHPGRAGNDGWPEEQNRIARSGPPDDDSGAGGNMADAGFGLLPLEGRRPEETGSRPGADVAVTPGAGSSLRRDDSGIRELETPERSGDRVFSLDLAPGPFAFSPDNPAWREILECAPWLAPAIEPGFRCMVNGTSILVDASRTDQLRSLGNGVVPLQAAVAITLLTREAGLEIE
jgi:DNA (cytosine-5)-methyltransferase 1